MYKNKPEVHVEQGEQLKLTIKRLGINGEGIGYYERKLVFVPGALPTERVIVNVVEDMSNFIRAELVEILTKSADRIDPVDDYANDVGGFELENLAYAKQLEFKRDVISDSLEKYQPAGYRKYKLLPTIGMDDPVHYRNKATFQIRNDGDKIIAGLYKHRSHTVVDLKTAALQYPLTIKVMRAVVAMIDDLKIPAYDEEKNAGIIKTVVVRAATATDEVQVTFITQSKKLLKKHQLLERIAAELPEVVSVMQNVNPGKTPMVWGDETLHLAGKDKITEVLNGLKFDLSARAFLQVNPQMTEVLYKEAFKALELTGKEKLIDAYSGVGTIGLSVANQVREVRGMDTIKDAVDDANSNAMKNGIMNAIYETGEAEKLIPEWIDAGWNPTALIVDPPRTGLADSLLDTILNVAPKKFVYISCNPSTLARDLVKLTRKYNVDYIQSVDLMPQTSRCECVVKFNKK
ncbi:23S rRNA (uracil-5-)-methyltransferase RumA [Lentilactobacillus parafarraginis DSM 18390 = JCM 14109]|jgi:23S rRNA (uracil-5-)-methyltransferase RumA|uniref:23S rRNA (Uracil-5-)-methyltransferase RumA n=2 Tax=Lentilactobacillus parafarraginis TaxID=390842 RepID=A0A0R1YKI8_9LACO|nr:23S rRNA (uracil(1939)-C(5))-methyltransferase RlmD [Lentilactobacillus parafarraginis]KRM42389.1 23S rRNA (uracil-5-)-methyltransferase RumA [Lentilactobacillus parafarraginis DSM 18390 = JCM 14109]